MKKYLNILSDKNLLKHIIVKNRLNFIVELYCKMKKLFLILIDFFLNSCGYTPLYSSKDSNYKVISLKKILITV